jgi:hypothetical protein
MTTITSTTNTVNFTIANPGSGEPTLILLRVGASQSTAQSLQYTGKIKNDYSFKVDPSTLRPGRYYTAVSFGGCCCLRTELFVDSSCSLASTSTTNTASGCGTC